jgi:uncharacterized protein
MPESLDFSLPIDDQKSLPLRLFAEGAILWPAGSTLFITDPHFGKAEHFRHAGIAIPSAILDHDLARLSRLITKSGASKLVVLGDFFHSRHSQSEIALTSLAAWRAQHAELDIVLVQGNHDAHAGPPPAEFGILSLEAPYPCGPFVCHHLPQPNAQRGEGYILAGHLHPYILLFDRGGSRMRLASFIFGPQQAILPAFGAFTGGSHYPPAPHDRVFAVAQGEIVEVPTSHRKPSPRR